MPDPATPANRSVISRLAPYFLLLLSLVAFVFFLELFIFLWLSNMPVNFIPAVVTIGALVFGRAHRWGTPLLVVAIALAFEWVTHYRLPFVFSTFLGTIALYRIAELVRLQWRKFRAADEQYPRFKILLLFILLFLWNVFNMSPLGNYGEDFFKDYLVLQYSVRHQINHAGFRGPWRTVRKPAGVYRIAVLGDSSAYGAFVRYEDTWSNRLEQRLNARPPIQEKFEVLDFGVSAYGIREANKHLRYLVLRYHPNIAIVVLGKNDAKYSPAEFRSGLKEFIAVARRHHVLVVLGTYPLKHNFALEHRQLQHINAVTRGVAAETGVPLVDLDRILLPMPQEGVFLLDRIHPTPKGHALYAKVVDHRLRELHIFDAVGKK
jgi:lysophospholipase L1-like esterase